MTPPCDSAHLCDVIIDCSYKMDIQFNMFTAMRTHAHTCAVTHPTVSGYNFRTSQHFSNI